MNTKLSILANQINLITNIQSRIFRLMRKRTKFNRRRQQRKRTLKTIQLKISMLSKEIVRWNNPKRFWTKVLTKIQFPNWTSSFTYLFICSLEKAFFGKLKCLNQATIFLKKTSAWIKLRLRSCVMNLSP